MSVFPQPGSAESPISVKSRYEHFIGGDWVPPVKGQYFENITPVTGKVFTEVARGTAEDIEAALDAAHAAAHSWGRTSATERANILNQIADRIEANLQDLAVIETWDNGKPVRESLAADLPLAVDHFRYFAGVLRAQEGTVGEIDETTVAYHFHEPLGVVAQIIPWNFPILMAVWKLAPALAAGNCVVLKPAEQTPWSILKVIEVIGDLLPAGVLNVVNGFGVEAGKPLASSPRVAKVAFTGETTTGRLIMQYASQNIIPVTLELGGKSPNIFFADVAEQRDAFYDKALEGFAMFALNQGEVCTCPSRALVQRSIYDTLRPRRHRPSGGHQAGQPARHRHDDRRPGLQRPAREDPVLRRDRQGRGRQGADRRRAHHPRGRPGRGLLRAADRLRGRQLDADLPGGDLRAGGGADLLRRRGRRAQDRQRHALRSRRRRCGPATAPAPTGSARGSRPAGSGPTATTPTPRARPSAATRSPASAARPTR